MRKWLFGFLVLTGQMQADLVLVADYGNSVPLDGFYITIIDSNTNIGTLVSLPNGRGPTRIAPTPDGTRAYVTVRNDDHNPPSNVSVVDLNAKQVINVISSGIDPFPNVVAVLPNGTKAYCGNLGNTVNIINTTTNAVVKTITVGTDSEAIAVTPDGSKVLVPSFSNNSVSVIDTTLDVVIATVGTGTSPFAIAITPDGTKAYIANFNGASVTALTIPGFTPSTITVGTRPNSLAVSPDGTKVYVCNGVSNSVSVISTVNNTVVTTIPGGNNTGVGISPNALAFSPDGKHVYVTTTLDGTAAHGAVAVIDVASNTATTLISQPGIGNGPQSVAVIADSTAAYTANANGNSSGIPGTVSAINTANNTAFQITSGVSTGPTFVTVAPNSWNLVGQGKKNVFISQIDFYNQLSWAIPVGAIPTQYRIYRNAALTDLIAVLPANILSYLDHNRQKNVTYSYYMTYIDAGGNVKSLGNVSVTAGS